jgi:gamma-glutamyl-gamma-aminobutyrate hydrolase PuuD
MDLRNDIIDIISSIQMIDNHYEEVTEEMSNSLAAIKLENILLNKQNELLNQKIDALAKHLSVKLEQPDTTIRAVKLDDGVSN